jgi:hypothetical protein
MSIIQLDDEDSERNEWQEEQYSIPCLVCEAAMKIMGKGPCDQLSKPRGSIDENLTGCLPRHVALGHERDRKYLTLKTNNAVLQMIPGENNCDFHRRNRDIHISTFFEIEMFEFVQFNHKFGTTVAHDVVKNAKRNKDH